MPPSGRVVELIPLTVVLIFALLAIGTEIMIFGRYDLLPANLPTLILVAIYILVSLGRRG